jgi:hypothetical protein
LLGSRLEQRVLSAMVESKLARLGISKVEGVTAYRTKLTDEPQR